MARARAKLARRLFVHAESQRHEGAFVVGHSTSGHVGGRFFSVRRTDANEAGSGIGHARSAALSVLARQFAPRGGAAERRDLLRPVPNFHGRLVRRPRWKKWTPYKGFVSPTRSS